ncbi:osmc family peroxiredoxin [Anaeramoeba ignava]|uniref:Osmc family peroxiredoxin n=1 Tax=Anaeramoeba ignava TaxID=1746090 RepID=A0A9Q0R9B8_ANAIG|nr:osmc family peroxiredoxin [Anaeramoeba ignava]|eukprot:Anaeramoba_ignava/a95031_40.p2 GENE.a95031_40~~a95031_40.p2  ORF type:complete len:171 (-),score=42.95 a95031_40:218-730(-)
MIKSFFTKPKNPFLSSFSRFASEWVNIKVSTIGKKEEPLHTQSQAANFQVHCDEPKNLGGNNKGPNPLYVTLSGLAGCEVVLLRMIAKEKKVEIGDVKMNINGKLDKSGLKGDLSVFPGFQTIEVEMKLESKADDKLLQEVVEAASKRCPVAMMLSTNPNIKFTTKWERL